MRDNDWADSVKWMIDVMDGRSQDAHVPGKWVRRFPVLVALKGFANGINPKYGTKTVVVSKSTGDIIRIEDRSKKRIKK